MKSSTLYSTEVRPRSVDIVLDHQHEYPSQWATSRSIAEKIGRNRETLRRWVRQRERNESSVGSPNSTDRDKINQLEHENRELNLHSSADRTSRLPQLDWKARETNPA